MRSHLVDLLAALFSGEHREQGWVFAIISDTVGHCYRKKGSVMLIGEDGQYLGMLSGGCLEGDIVRQAQRVFASKKTRRITYDFSEDSDEAWQLGMGCGGTIEVFLSVVTASMKHALKLAYDELSSGREICLSLNVAERQVELGLAVFSSDDHKLYDSLQTADKTSKPSKQKILVTTFKPKPKLLIVGNGPDVVPLIEMSQILGWQLAVFEQRVKQPLVDKFPQVQCVDETYGLVRLLNQRAFDACMVMTHNIIRDARYLEQLQSYDWSYLGLLGPTSRTKKVFKMMNYISPTLKNLKNPAGLELGGEGAEAIALSILSECHGTLYESSLQEKIHPLLKDSDVSELLCDEVGA